MTGLRLGLVADTHVAPAGTPPAAWHGPLHLDRSLALLDAAVGRLVVQGIDALVHCGDLTHLADDDSLEAALLRLAATEVPTYLVAGNHDSGPDRLAAAAARHGAALRTVGVAGVALADGVRLAGAHALPGEPPRTSAPPDVEAWGEDLVVWCCHHPLLDLSDRLAAAGVRDAGTTTDRDQILRPLLRRPAPTLVLHGHLHVRALMLAGPVAQWSQPAVIEAPHEATVVEIADHRGGHAVHIRSAFADAPYSPHLLDGPDRHLQVIAPWGSSTSASRERAEETASTRPAVGPSRWRIRQREHHGQGDRQPLQPAGGEDAGADEVVGLGVGGLEDPRRP